jgi:hypothetical protein
LFTFETQCFLKFSGVCILDLAALESPVICALIFGYLPVAAPSALVHTLFRLVFPKKDKNLIGFHLTQLNRMT